MFTRSNKIALRVLPLLFTLYLFLVSLNCVFSATEEELEAWRQYKATYNKNYPPEEDAKRLEIFLDNKRYIESHNTKSQDGFQQGLNPLSDLTTEEINLTRNGFRLNTSDEVVPETEAALIQLFSSVADDFELPSNRVWYENLLKPELDYRKLRRVSRVKDQGSCGSCWAYATTGAIESILAAKNITILLSEQQLVDCSRRYGNMGCSGGWMDAALRYVRDHGIMSAQDYPYQGEDLKCKASRSKTITRVKGSLRIPRGNEAFLRIALALTGPMPVAIDAGARSFHSYKSGIYNDRVCKNSPKNLNHAVLLVGYGTSNDGHDYWILKNSWGRSWGDNGYIKMARNRGNVCGVATYAVMPIP